MSSLDDDKLSVFVLENSYAFDTIDHAIIISRLKTVFGIHSITLQLSGYTCPNSTLLFNVPQGSVLGLVLFVIYTPQLSTDTKQHTVNYIFADTTTKILQAHQHSGVD